MSRKHIDRCQVCGRPAARDAMVKLTVAGQRGPQAVPWVQTGPPLRVCPVCARTRTFRVAVDPEPVPPGQPEPSPGSEHQLGPWFGSELADRPPSG